MAEVAEAGPWTKYAPQADTEAGPWTKYAAPSPPAMTPNDISGEGRDEYGNPLGALGPPGPSASLPTIAEMRQAIAPTPGWVSSGILPMATKEVSPGQGDPSAGVKLDWGPVRSVVNPLLDLLEGTGQATSVGGPNAPLAGKVSPEASALLFSSMVGNPNPLANARTLLKGGTPMVESGPFARGTPLTPAEAGAAQAKGDARAAPLPPEFRASPTAPGFDGPTPAPVAIDIGGGRTVTVPAANPIAAPSEVNRNLPQNMRDPVPLGAAQGAMGGAVGADITTAPIPPPTPAEKATALQKMVNQSAEDRLTPQGRDDAVYFPGVVRPEAMKDFSNAPEGQMSSALQHKALYNTDSNYHDQFDAQVKNNNAIMLDGTTLPDGTRVDGLHDMFGDANAREAAMNDARALMPGSVHLFDNEKPVDIQPVADTINKILASSKGKIDGVANVLRKILPKLYDKDGTPETMPSMIKGIFDDVNNKLYDKSPTIEGNEARQASDQLKQVKAALSEVIGGGLPGSKWTDYLTNLSTALGQVDKLDYMQQFLTGTKKLTNGSGDLQFNKVSKMLEDIQKHSTDQTGGARLMTRDEINKIEAVRNELAAKDLLDKRAAVRGSPTTQLTNAAGFLGSGPLGTAVKAAAEGGAHLLLAAKTAGVGNLVLAGVKAGRKASEAQKATNALMATKGRLLDTTPRNPLGPE